MEQPQDRPSQDKLGGVWHKRPHRWHHETWWWNEHVGEVITAKRQAFKAWKTGKGTRASYHAAKRIARRTLCLGVTCP